MECAYAARTVLEAQRTGQDPNSVRFSPSFLYNQIKLNEECQGSYIQYAMDYMQNKGAVPFSKFAYNDEDCQKQPDATLQSMAQNYKTKGFTRLTMDGDEYTPDLNAMRQHISQGSPVVIGMMVGGSFMREMEGQKVWIPNQEDYGMSGFGGHAMCIVGYDDNLEGGSFQIMNSWGKNWGENGFGWVRYNDFKYFATHILCHSSHAIPINKAIGA
jgi:C1A family cysteine protease